VRNLRTQTPGKTPFRNHPVRVIIQNTLFVKDKTDSEERVINSESYQPTIERGLTYQLVLIVGKVGQGMRSCKQGCKCTSHDLYDGECQ
jgi:hypothetical protein